MENQMEIQTEIATNSTNVEEPSMIELLFNSEEEVYDFYNLYARTIGFSIRRNQVTKTKEGKITRREITCSAEGFYKKKNTPVKNRPEARTGCQAMLEVRLNDNGQYVITNFREEHNHDLEPQSRAHMLKSQRNIKPAQANLVVSMRAAGIGPATIYSFFRAEAGGSERLNFTRMDCNNIAHKKRVDFLKQGDATCLLDYFKNKQRINKSFFYDIATDDDNRLCSCFWSDAKSRIDYNFFGDVICFDTTFNTNNYGMICAPIAGVNNHGQTVLFGCALLSDEKTESFVWLFNTFLNAMCGKHPKTIFTDQAQSMANAIKLVFPDTHHRLCLWHIYLNATSNLSNVFREHESFSTDLQRCIYDPETEDEFESSWKDLLVKYGLVENDWLGGLYEIREKWAQVYGRSHFCAGMTTTQRSESVNSFLKKFLPRSSILREFIEQYDSVMVDRREKEVNEAKKSSKRLVIKIGWDVERQASKIYTRKAFEEFQNEVIQAINWNLELVGDDGTTKTYSVKYFLERRRNRTVTFVSSNQAMKCSCKKFEFTGILCCHILKLVHSLEWVELPSEYYLNRWRKDATSDVVVDADGGVIRNDVDPSLSIRYSELSCITQSIVAKAAISTDIFDLARTELLQVKQKIDSFSTSSKEYNSANAEENVDEQDPTQNMVINDPIKKRKRGQPKKRIKNALEKMSTRLRKSKGKKAQTGGKLPAENFEFEQSSAMEKINYNDTRTNRKKNAQTGGEIMEENMVGSSGNIMQQMQLDNNLIRHHTDSNGLVNQPSYEFYNLCQVGQQSNSAYTQLAPNFGSYPPFRILNGEPYHQVVSLDTSMMQYDNTQEQLNHSVPARRLDFRGPSMSNEMFK